MRNLIIGFVLGIATSVAGMVAFAFLFSGPTLSITASAQASATPGGAMVIVVEAKNVHDEAIKLDNLDVPNEFFENLNIVSIRPNPLPDSPVGGLGIRTWFFDLEIAPNETLTIELEVVATQPGEHVAEFQVCNFFQDCSWVAVPLSFEP